MNAWLKLALEGSVLSTLTFLVAAGCGDDGKNAVNVAEGGESGGGGGPVGGASDTGGGSSTPDAGEPGSGGIATGGAGDEPGTGGTAMGGSDGVGGSDSAGGSDGVGGSDGAGGSGNPDPNASVARFCNELSGADLQNIRFILQVGEGDDMVTFTADSFECAPADGNACLAIPLGVAVPVALYEEGDPVPWYEGSIFSEAEDQWIFYTVLEEGVSPSVEGTTTNGDIACDDVTYDYVYPPL